MGAGVNYAAWGVSWLGTWGNSWGPLHEVEEQGGSSKGKPTKPKTVYIERDGKILLFRNASHAAAYIAAEKAAEPVVTTKVTKKKVKPKVVPVKQPEVIEIDVLQLLFERFKVEQDLSEMLRAQEFEALLALQKQLLEQQDEEDIEILLLAA